jgi:hypothetical protein
MEGQSTPSGRLDGASCGGVLRPVVLAYGPDNQPIISPAYALHREQATGCVLKSERENFLVFRGIIPFVQCGGVPELWRRRKAPTHLLHSGCRRGPSGSPADPANGRFRRHLIRNVSIHTKEAADFVA